MPRPELISLLFSDSQIATSKRASRRDLSTQDIIATQRPIDEFEAAETAEYRSNPDDLSMLYPQPDTATIRVNRTSMVRYIAGAGAAITILRLLSSIPESHTSSTENEKHALTVSFDIVNPKPPPPIGRDSYVRARIEAPEGLNVRHGTVMRVMQIDPYDSEKNANGATDVARITGPGKEWKPFTAIDFFDELDKSGKPNETVYLIPGDTLRITIFGQNEKGYLDTNAVLADTVVTIPKDLPSVDLPAQEVVSTPPFDP